MRGLARLVGVVDLVLTAEFPNGYPRGRGSLVLVLGDKLLLQCHCLGIPVGGTFDLVSLACRVGVVHPHAVLQLAVFFYARFVYRHFIRSFLGAPGEGAFFICRLKIEPRKIFTQPVSARLKI